MRFVIVTAIMMPAMRTQAGDSTSGKIEFNRDIRPILSDNCFACHGPDKNQRKAKLRLDVREVALEREAFVAGKPGESELVRRINATNEDDVMPPPAAEKTLTPKQKELLVKWIAQGAEYQPHWAYITPKRPAVPEVRGQKSEVRNPIDSFVRAELERRKVQPSPEAARATLLRRLSLDLIGLPPTPEEVEAFVKDTNPNAYEKQVDRLLASPHYGERMAAPWLDVVRFADTVGYHGDQPQNIFPYRDYVINAFNSNKPFDQFTIEQLAGDLLPNPTIEQRIATGFNRLNMMTREGGAQPKEYLAKYAADRVRTVSGAWLGSTMGCAECHDHKFDPFSTKDFYQMEAFFADIKQWGYYADAPYAPVPELKGFVNEHPFPPEIEVESPYLKARIEKLRGELNETQADAWKRLETKNKSPSALPERRSVTGFGADDSRKPVTDPRSGREVFAEWRSASRAFSKKSSDGWLAPRPAVVVHMKDTNAVAITNFMVQPDATIVFTRETRTNTTIKLSLTNQWLVAIRLEVVPQKAAAEMKPPEAEKPDVEKPVAEKPEAKKVANKQPARKKAAKKKGQGNPSDIRLSASLKAGGKDAKLEFSFADADHQQPRYDMALPILGVSEVWKLSLDHDSQTAVWLLNQPVKVASNATLVVSLGGAEFASLRVSVSAFAADEPLKAGGGEPLRKALNRMALFRSAAQQQLIERTFLLSTDTETNFLAQTHKLQREVRECRGGRIPTQVTEALPQSGTATTRVLPRGNWQDDSGEIVQPAPPHFLPQLTTTGTNRQTRLDLARWLVSPENPLTSRTVMNRLWKQFFGTGISAVVDDVGAQGEWPTHPELLDWLAVELMQPTVSQLSTLNSQPPHGWDFKHMVKLIAMSATYRQAAGLRPDLKEIDPNNRLLAGQSPRRLDAEFVRDNALFVAGVLNEEIGGPSAHPYQPAGYYANMQFPNRDYYADQDERQYRRGLYTWWQRAFLHPMMANFDAPAREECTAARTVSNTPQQALTLLNDPTFVEASRLFAARILAANAVSDDERMNLAFQRALARSAKPVEMESLKNFLATQRDYYGGHPEDAKKLLRIGLAPEPKAVNEPELAAWTHVCRVVLNLHESITLY